MVFFLPNMKHFLCFRRKIKRVKEHSDILHQRITMLFGKLVIAGGDGRQQTGKQFIAKAPVFQFLPLMLKLESIHSL